MLIEEDGDEFLIEGPPFLRQLIGEVLVNTEIRSNESTREAFLGVCALFAEHQSVEVPHDGVHSTNLRVPDAL